MKNEDYLKQISDLFKRVAREEKKYIRQREQYIQVTEYRGGGLVDRITETLRGITFDVVGLQCAIAIDAVRGGYEGYQTSINLLSQLYEATNALTSAVRWDESDRIANAWRKRSKEEGAEKTG